MSLHLLLRMLVVYISAKIRIFKQITTTLLISSTLTTLFISVQRYEFLSKSQQELAVCSS